MTERETAALFKTLSDETRVRIVKMLAEDAVPDADICGAGTHEGLCACTILEAFAISQPTLSYHMKILMESGLVHGVKDGVWMRYTINAGRVAEAVAFFDSLGVRTAC